MSIIESLLPPLPTRPPNRSEYAEIQIRQTCELDVSLILTAYPPSWGILIPLVPYLTNADPEPLFLLDILRSYFPSLLPATL
jgi:hypothetical protein